MILTRRRDLTKPCLLLHCNGTDTSTAIAEDSPESHNAFNCTGSAQIDTDQSKFGGSSLLLDGTGDYVKSQTTTVDFNLTTDFTIDLWVRPASVASTNNIINYFDSASGANVWGLYYSTSGPGIMFDVFDGAPVYAVQMQGSTTSMSINTWYHVAMCKVGNEYGLYQDGVQVDHVSDSDTATIGTGDTYLNIGSNITNDGGFWDGHLDEIRICKFNAFNAAPVVGLTDTIQVPVLPYPSWS